MSDSPVSSRTRSKTCKTDSSWNPGETLNDTLSALVAYLEAENARLNKENTELKEKEELKKPWQVETVLKSDESEWKTYTVCVNDVCRYMYFEVQAPDAYWAVNFAENRRGTYGEPGKPDGESEACWSWGTGRVHHVEEGALECEYGFE